MRIVIDQMELLFILHRLRCLHLYDGVAVAVVAVAVVVVAVFPKKWIEKLAELFQILLLDFIRSNIVSFNIN